MSQENPAATSYEGSRVFSGKLLRGIGGFAASAAMAGAMAGSFLAATRIGSEVAQGEQSKVVASADWQPEAIRPAAPDHSFVVNSVEVPPVKNDETQLAHDIVDEYNHLHEEPDEIGEANRVREENEGAESGVYAKGPDGTGMHVGEQTTAQPVYGPVTNIDQLQRIA